jgi:tetratricopeptide (TPR) repeat protein
MMPDMVIEQTLQAAITHHKAGETQDAERLYRSILNEQASHPDANHNLGIILKQGDQIEAAVVFFKTALDANPNQGQFWISYIDALIHLGRLDAARSILEQGQSMGLKGEVVDQLASRIQLPQYNQSPLSQAQIDSVVALYSQGQLQEALDEIDVLIKDYPNESLLYNISGACYQALNQLDAAVKSYERALSINPDYAEVHNNLGNTHKELGQLDDAVKYYEQALVIKPASAEVYSNLAIVHKELGQLDDAVKCYEQALVIKPDFAEVYSKLGIVHKELGQLNTAVECYEKSLIITSDFDAETYNNVANILKDLGQIDRAVKCLEQALLIKPDFIEAHKNLAGIFKELGQESAAIKLCEAALAINPLHEETNYLLATIYLEHHKYKQAISYFRIAHHLDWNENILLCLYKLEQFDGFKEQLITTVASKKVSPLLGALSTHYSQNFEIDNLCNFCPYPLDYVFHTQIPELLEKDGYLISELLHDISNIDISPRPQGRLRFGVQSSGNLLIREEKSFRTLSIIIKQIIYRYHKSHLNSENDFIRFFPKKVEFSSSWYIKMKKGGYLNSHIHEKGWLSGAIYLSIPRITKNSNEGAIELSIDGDDYPRLHNRFPKKVIQLKKGDVVFFPSSLFHRTIPFESNEERVCIAFDIQPQYET